MAVVAASGAGRGLVAELEERGLLVVRADPRDAVGVAAAVAPDLVVLDPSVDAATAAGLLEGLRGHPVGRVLGVLQAGAEAPLSAPGFTFGLVETLLGQPLPLEIADQALRTLATRAAARRVVTGRVTRGELPELLATLAAERRTGVFALSKLRPEDAASGDPPPPLAPPLALVDGEAVLPDADAFLARVAGVVTEPLDLLRWELLEKPPGGLRVVGPIPDRRRPPDAIRRPGRVVVLGAPGASLERLRTLAERTGVVRPEAAPLTPGWTDAPAVPDPTALLIDLEWLGAAGYPMLRASAGHPRLGGAHWVLAHVPSSEEAAVVEALADTTAPEEWIAGQLTGAEPLHLRVEGLGVGRALRAVGAHPHLVAARFEAAHQEASLDLGAGRIHGGQVRRPGGAVPVGGGTEALADVLGRTGGRVAVERLRRPARVDLGGSLARLLGGEEAWDVEARRAGDAPRRDPDDPGRRRRRQRILGVVAGAAVLAGSLAIAAGGGARSPGPPPAPSTASPPPTVAGEPPARLPVSPTPPVTADAPPLSAQVRHLGEVAPGRVAARPEPSPKAAGMAPEARSRRARTARFRALDAREVEDWPGAERWIREGLRLTPDDPELTRELALALFRQRRVVDSAPWARRAVILAPEEPEGWVLLGDVLGSKRDVDGARAAWRRALGVGPGYRPARRRLERLDDDSVVHAAERPR